MPHKSGYQYQFPLPLWLCKTEYLQEPERRSIGRLRLVLRTARPGRVIQIPRRMCSHLFLVSGSVDLGGMLLCSNDGYRQVIMSEFIASIAGCLQGFRSLIEDWVLGHMPSNFQTATDTRIRFSGWMDHWHNIGTTRTSDNIALLIQDVDQLDYIGLEEQFPT